MSSACICHLNEFCFHCEVHLPLARKYESLKYKLHASEKKVEELEQERNDLFNGILTALHIWDSMDDFDENVLIVINQVIESLRSAKRGVNNATS